MRSSKYLVIIILFFSNYCYAQFTNKLFIIDSDRFPINDNIQTYTGFYKDSFVLFTLSQNPKEGEVTYDISEFGMGTYTFKENNLVLNFKNQREFVSPLLMDSIGVTFSSDPTLKGTRGHFQYSARPSNWDYASLEIVTTNKSFVFNAKDHKLDFFVPDSLIIQKIKLHLITFDGRELPYDYHFNVINYDYFLRDTGVVLSFIPEETMSFTLKKTPVNDHYKIDGFGYFRKLPDDYLSKYLVKQLKEKYSLLFDFLIKHF